jgi:hypothetical protein
MERPSSTGGDPTESAIADVLVTLRGTYDLAAHSGPEDMSLPEQLSGPVDFDRHAREAVESGLFAEQPETPGLSRFERRFMPDRPLYRAWGSGTFLVTDGHDMPGVAVNAHRKLLAEASRTILKPELVEAFFDDHLATKGPLNSDSIIRVLEEFRPDTLTYGDFQDSAHSFQLADRRVDNRRVYTEEEMAAGLELAEEYPELVLAIASYNSIILDYLDRFRDSLLRQDLMDERGKAEIDRYIENWITNNFYDAFIPGLAIAVVAARERHPDMPMEQLLDGPLFSYMFRFGLYNGMFQNHMTVRAENAQDGVAHEIKFRCPLAGVIADHLFDGKLLDSLHSSIRDKIAEGDTFANATANTISAQISSWREVHAERTALREAAEAEAAKPIVEVEIEDGMDLFAALGEATFQAKERRKPATFTLGGTTYTINPDAFGSYDSWLGQAEPTDVVYDTSSGGNYLPGLITYAMGEAMRSNKAITFKFNFDQYRVTPQQARSRFPGLLPD